MDIRPPSLAEVMVACSIANKITFHEEDGTLQIEQNACMQVKRRFP
jgi:hypothetical protein